MATLQKIRSKGPLLVIAVGLALFAFIAGDAWQVIQPHQSQDVGEINGESLSAQDYQALLEEYTEVVKFTSGLSALSDAQSDQLSCQQHQAQLSWRCTARCALRPKLSCFGRFPLESQIL